jgi:hypothetical protein
LRPVQALRQLSQPIEIARLAGVQNDSDRDAASMRIDQGVDDGPVRQHIGGEVDLGARRAQKRYVEAFQILGGGIMDFKGLGRRDE